MLATKISQIKKISAVVNPLPKDLFLFGTSSNAHSDQISNIQQPFQAIYLIHDILDSKEDSDPDINAILAKLLELTFNRNFDTWMKLFWMRLLLLVLPL